jgi:hypothetical protein
MTQDEIIEMAREAGMENNEGFSESVFYFAKLVAEKEREACAKVCEDLDVEDWPNRTWDIGTLDCAKAIRARGQA